MDTKQIELLLVSIFIAFLVFILIGGCIYVVATCYILQFRKVTHLLTLNVCLAIMLCTAFWTIYFVLSYFWPDLLWTSQTCLPIIYAQNVVNCHVTFALSVVSLNRLFTCIYGHASCMHTKLGVILCFGIEWFTAIVLPLPAFASNVEHCLETGLLLGYQIYTLFIIVVLPTIFILTINIIIVARMIKSSRMVEPINVEQRRLSIRRRDFYLLKRMFFMFIAFVGGWTPIYIIAVINWNGPAVPHTIQRLFTVLPILSLLIDMISLFFYNYELRRRVLCRLRITQA